MTLKQIDRAAQRFADELMIPTEIPGTNVGTMVLVIRRN